ncbi:MAG: LIC12162 family protein [bacterium]|nr:LIC12162 family protein [bacterium]
MSGSPIEVEDVDRYKSAVILGPWCCAYRSDLRFEDQKSFELAPPPWDWAALKAASDYVDGLADRLCDAFFASLKKENPGLAKGSVDRDFIRRHFKGWLLLWLGIAFERFRRLEHIREAYPGEVFRVRIFKRTHYNESGLTEFYSKQVGQEYNLLLFSDMIREMQGRWKHFEASEIESEWKETFVDVDPDARREAAARAAGEQERGPTRLQLLKRRIASLAAKLNFTIRPDVHGRSLSFRERLRLQWKLAPRHLLFPFVSYEMRELPVVEKDWGRWGEFFEAQNDFESVLPALLWKYMPADYAKLYAARTSRRKLAQTVWIGGDNYSPGGNDLCSEIRGAGGKVYTYQHGGGYGQYASFANEDVERVQIDAFLSWGWTDKRGPAIALPSPYLSDLKRHNSQSQNQTTLILAGTMLPPVVYKLQTSLSPEQLLSYIEDKKEFIQALESGPSEALEYRPAKLDFGIEEQRQVEAFLPAERISFSGRLTERLQRCRLAVFDHMATSFLEGLAMNTPSVLFWRPEYFGLNDQAAEDLAMLERAGIYFANAAQAADHVNRVWSDVAGWWHSKQVQNARESFCERYARRDDSWLEIWQKELRAAQRAK